MRVIVRHWSYGILLLFVSCLIGVNGILHKSVQADDAVPSWLSVGAPKLTKIVDLSANTPPPSLNIDCAPMSYTPSYSSTPQTVCATGTSLGEMAVGELFDGSNKAVRMEGAGSNSYPLLSPNGSLTLISSSGSTGQYIFFYEALTRADLQLNITTSGTYYSIRSTRVPDGVLSDPSTKAHLQANTNALAYSPNGQWMVVDVPFVGLARVDLQTFDVKIFGPSLEQSYFYGLSTAQLAISDDGQYVAVSPGNGNGGTMATGLTVYDLSTCSGVALDARSCQYKNTWNGQTAHGKVDTGIAGQLNQPGKPVNLRFVNDQTLSFNVTYNNNGRKYDTAKFVATIGTGSLHAMGLLGMGDSYISGQGEFTYKSGTDTDNNTCHLSPLSYPFILGAQYFGSYNSVACSGATTSDITNSNRTYTGQVKDKIAQKSREMDSILNTFSPGYIYQNDFASKYTPEAILLSVGGNDVGFANILQSCVTSLGSCYDTYEDRAELVNQIDNEYNTLRQTYAQTKEASPASRIYVVGYPQIAKVGGSCGQNVHLNSDEVLFASQLIDYLDGVIKQAAQAEGVYYVDTQQAFDGHRLCEGSDSSIAVNGFTVGEDAGITIPGFNFNVKFVGSESYHPTQEGHKLLAAAIDEATDGLTAPMPTPSPDASGPIFDSTLPLLSEVPSTGRQINWVTYDDSLTDDVVLSGNSEQLTVDSADVPLQPGGQYQVVLHSTPITLGYVKADASGTISTAITIPADIEPGFHTIHIYGKDVAGENVDVQKIIYVAPANGDYGGNQCLVVPMSGQDVDQDGIDDACDAVIGKPPVVVDNSSTVSFAVTPQTTKTVDQAQPVVLSAAILQTSSSQQSPDDQLGTTGKVLGASNPIHQNNIDEQASVVPPAKNMIGRGVWILAGMVLLTITGAILLFSRRRV